jgi:hypothetical protein
MSYENLRLTCHVHAVLAFVAKEHLLRAFFTKSTEIILDSFGRNNQDRRPACEHGWSNNADSGCNVDRRQTNTATEFPAHK